MAQSIARPGRESGFIGITLIGEEELQEAFQNVVTGMRNRVLKRAVTKAGRVMVSPLRAATPRAAQLFGKQAARNPPGTMKKSTGIVFRKYRGGDIQSVYVGHRWPKGAAAHLYEAGTSERMTSDGHRTGAMPSVPFMAPVYARLRGQIQDTLRDEITIGLGIERTRALARAVKKSGM